MTKYKQNCVAIQEQIQLLQIVKRRICDDNLASFTLHQPEGSGHVLGHIEVTVTPLGFVTVTGDYDTCAFARYGGNHWRGAINWIGRTNYPSAYVMEKARMGMNLLMSHLDSEHIVEDLKQYLEDESISKAVYEDCIGILELDEYSDPEHASWEIYDTLREAGMEGEDFCHLGRVPDYAVVAATAVLHRLDQLLNQEEQQPTGESA